MAVDYLFFLLAPLSHTGPQLYAFGGMGFPSGMVAAIHRYYCDTDELQLPVEHGNALWVVILDSPRESCRYRDAFSALLSSDHEQKLLYTLRDPSAIERMLSILELVSSTNDRLSPTCPRTPETFQPEGITGG